MYKLISIILISCLGSIVYSNTFYCSFHFDDQLYIINNYGIRNIHNLFHIWTFYPCRFVTFLSIGLNYYFNGLDVFGYHLFNLTVHLVTAILVWWLTLLTLSTPVMKEQKIAHHANIVALCVGLVFVSHPVQTEAVTYIWQRAASLATLFYVASLCFYVQSRMPQDEKSTRGAVCKQRFYYISSLLTAVVAMFTKEMTVTLPLMILLYEFSFLSVKKTLNWKYLIPFLLTLFVFPLTIILLPKSARYQEILGALSGLKNISPGHYFLTQLRVMVTYIRLVFLPLNQNFHYDYPVSKSIFELPTLSSGLFLSIILLFATRLFSKYRWISFSIFWFFLALLPESSAIPFEDVIYEHRLYLPLVGYSMFLVSGMYYLLGKNNLNAMVKVLMAIIVCNSVLTYQRNKIWRDEISLWQDVVRKSPHIARPYNVLGAGYFQQGHFNQAMADYNKAIEINPNLTDAYNNRGLGLAQQGHFVQAISDYNKAIEIVPEYALAYYNRAIAYDNQGRFVQAISDYNKAIEIDSNDALAYYNRGCDYYKQGQFAQALSDYNKAIAIDPNFAKAYNNRGWAYDNQGRMSQAISDYNKAIAIDPHYALAYNNRGWAYYNQGRLTQAISDYNKAIAIDPHFAKAYYNCASAYNSRAFVYYNQGKMSQALVDLTQAIKKNSSYAAAYNNRAFTYYKLKEYKKAWEDVHKAEELGVSVNPKFLSALKKASGNNATR